MVRKGKGADKAAGEVEQVGAGRINRQVLNLGLLDVMTQEGTAMAETSAGTVPFQSFRLKPRLEKLEEERIVERIFQRDGSVWKSDPREQEGIRHGLGWLDTPEKMRAKAAELTQFAEEVRASGFTHVVHMGMGGSSLAPLVFQHMYGLGPGGLPLTVLDTTDPLTIVRLEQKVDLSKTLFVVASKSGTTAEPLAFESYFYERVRTVKGQRAGESFVAITDPDTPLVRSAGERQFHRTFLNFSDLGGRYSALSYFGLVPAALMGLDVDAILGDALRMAAACGPSVPVRENPGVALGAVMGEAARMGRDKITFLLADDLAVFGLWLEQLIAESTGKEGTGLLPVTGEPAGDPLDYGDDRLFVSISIKDSADAHLGEAVQMLQAASLPVVFIELAEAASVAQEFFRWEFATAIAGAVLGINPFDQPNVQESKDATNRLLQGVQERGSLTEPAPVMVHGPLSFFSKEGAENPEKLLWAFLSKGRPGDYISLQAYLAEETSTDALLRAIRLRLRDDLRLATTVGYGPRFLHSTGQFHKGGPNTGLFIQLTGRDGVDISIPGKPYTFGIFKRAQALGDLDALGKHGRRVMRIDLGDDVKKGLSLLSRLLERALAEGPGGE
ncbi:MAG: glucose-6-phosphate isomerase [Syntrophorhabdales bacterium]|jgi:glucose-6-phosphate isomerase